MKHKTTNSLQPQHEGKNTWEKKNTKEYAARHLIQHYN